MSVLRTRVNDDRPAVNVAAVTPHDTNTIETCRALYIGVSGDVKVTAKDGGTATFLSVPIGILPVMTNQVFATGTTATDIIALY